MNLIDELTLFTVKHDASYVAARWRF